MSDTQKRRNFLSEPMGRKPVTELPGVGKTIGGQLGNRGYDKASNVFGQYLVQGGDNRKFTNWMKNNTSANSKQAGDCAQTLNEYRKEFL